MKSRVLKIGLCIAILVSLVAASFALVRPVYLGLGSVLRSKIAELNSTLDKSFGLNVSYSSLSPSILTGINIKSIDVRDTATGETVLTVKRATARFSIREIIKGNFENAISGITVNDVYAEIIRGKNTTWLDYTISNNLDASSKKETVRLDEKSLLDLLADSEINIDIPCNININNLTVVYKDRRNNINGTAYLRKAYAEKTLTKGKYTVEFIGQVSGNFKQNNFSLNMFLQSSLLSGLNNSSAVIQLFNTTVNGYTVRQLGFLGEYAKSVFSFKMLPTVQNLYLELSADLKKHDAKLRFDSNNFRVSHLVKGIKKGSSFETLSSLLVSAGINVSYNWDSKKINYDSSGDVNIPDLIIPGGLAVSFALNGNQNYLNVPYFTGTGEKIDVGFGGGFNLKSYQPEGVLSVNRLQLENDGVITTEFYFEPLAKGFMAFSPEIMFGEKTFTAAMLNFIPQRDGFDFDFEIYDYSHADTGEPGHLALDGNYLTSSKFFQSNINLDGMYIDSLMDSVAFFLDKNKSGLVKDAAPIFKNTIFSTAVYISAYDGNFSYSVPSAIIADTTSDNKMLMVSLDGNKETLQINRFELILNDQNILATAHSENIYDSATKTMQTILAGQVDYNSIPYGFSGLLHKDWISITGDYGLNFSFINDAESDNLLGNFSLNGFPVKLSDSTLSFSADTNFFYNLQDKININVTKFEVQSLDGISEINPVFAFAGRVDKTGTYLEEISYTDIVSNLTGNGVVMWNFEDADFLNANYNIDLQDPLYSEHIQIVGDITNPSGKSFTTEALLNDYYISSEINLTGFRTGRFTGNTTSADSMTANLSITGILGNPMVSIFVPGGTVAVNNVPMTFSLQASVVDKEFELQNADVVWGQTEISNITSKFSFNEWKGFLALDAKTVVLDKTLVAPLRVEAVGIKNSQKPDAIPESFEIDITSSRISGSFIKAPQGLNVHIVKLPEDILISSSSNFGLNGTIAANGEMNLAIENKVPFKMKVSGNIKKNADLRFYDIDADLAKTMKLIDFGLLKVFNGKVTGEFAVTGPRNDRGFTGLVQIIPAEFNMPDFFKNHAKTDVINLMFEKDLIHTPKTRCMLKKAPVDVTVSIAFKQMNFDNLTVLVETVDDAYAPVNINMNQVHVKGNAQVDLEITVEPENISVVGGIVAKDATAEFGTSTLSDVVQSMNQENTAVNNTTIEVMLDVTMKSRVQVFYSSFLRGLVVPDSKVVFAFNSADDRMTLDGKVPLRSGELMYLNSSFYVKEGMIDFSSKDNGIDPYVTLRAETREKDESNSDVTISLSVDHQKINDLAPKLTSSPAKSEKEILELLGSFVSANSDSMASFMLATGDYALQTMLVRKVENALRDFLNFDILSIRTTVVQNALKYSISQDSERQGMNISNFFDNTTVYIGKYFGSSLYADAMVRLVYDKNRVNDSSTLRGLIFEPEIGFEMESPLAKIRWSLEPDLTDLSRNKLVVIPSLTLSWKFNY